MLHVFLIVINLIAYLETSSYMVQVSGSLSERCIVLLYYIIMHIKLVHHFVTYM